MKAHHATVSVFSKKEAVDESRAILPALLPKDAIIQETVLEPETEGEVFLQEIIEIKCRLTKQPEIKALAARVFSGLDDYDRGRLLEGLSERVDEDCNLYVRISRSEAASGRMVLENRDCVHMVFKIAAYPAKRENALIIAKELIEDALH